MPVPVLLFIEQESLAALSGQVFIIVMCAVLVVLSLHEGIRYRRAAGDPEALPYPRRRLMRRHGIALLFIVVLLGAYFWPEESGPYWRLGVASAMLVLLAFALLLLLRDLHESSVAVVTMTHQINRRTALELEELVAMGKRAEQDRTPQRKTGAAGDQAPAPPVSESTSKLD